MFFITYNLGAYCEQDGAYKLPDRITEINRSAFRGSIKYGENDYLTIKLDLNKTEKIGEYAFCDCDMSNLTNEIKLGNNINNISPYAFKDCKKLTTIKIPDKLDIIDKGLFEGCEKLGSITSVEIPDNIITINGNAFKGCKKLKSITTTNTTQLKYIKYGAFEGCEGLESFEIPKTIIELGNYAFRNCTSYKLNFTILSNLSEIGYCCFENSGITEILSNDNQNLKSIKEGTFKDCKYLTSVDISNCSNIKTICKYAFSESSCSNVKLPNIINIIENSAFEGCKELESFNLPSNLTRLGHSCLLTRTGTRINIPIELETPPSFINTSSNSKYAPKFPFGDPKKCIIDIYISNFNLVNKYKTNSNWKQYSSRIFAISMKNNFSGGTTTVPIAPGTPGINGGGTMER